jgi:hypothetical protein
VEAGLVADDAIVAYDTRLVVVGVHHTAVLDAGPLSDVDLRHVGPEDRVGPDAGLFPHRDGTHEDCRIVDARTRRESR